MGVWLGCVEDGQVVKVGMGRLARVGMLDKDSLMVGVGKLETDGRKVGFGMLEPDLRHRISGIFIQHLESSICIISSISTSTLRLLF